MALTAEELLKARYKVVAPYPAMGLHNIKVGDVINSEGKTKDGFVVVVFEWKAFPQIFKKLSWYEEREEHEMPQYIIGRHRGFDNYVKVDKWTMVPTYPHSSSYPMTTLDGVDYFAPYSTPISEEEYIKNKHHDNRTA